jgi:hypothetical protein
MKIQMDTITKVIKIEESVNLKELFDLLEQMLPNEMWKEFTLETNTTIINWSQPITYPIIPIPCPNPTIPSYPWYTPTTGDPIYFNHPTTICDVSNNLNSGVYNIEVNL